jgi:hypothetical protein
MPIHHSAFGRFISHCVWTTPDKIDMLTKKTNNSSSLLLRIKNRINEMKERRNRLTQLNLRQKNDAKTHYSEVIGKKQEILKDFPTGKLENCLKISTTNVARELVECLIPVNQESGILLDLEKLFSIKTSDF